MGVGGCCAEPAEFPGRGAHGGGAWGRPSQQQQQQLHMLIMLIYLVLCITATSAGPYHHGVPGGSAWEAPCGRMLICIKMVLCITARPAGLHQGILGGSVLIKHAASHAHGGLHVGTSHPP